MLIGITGASGFIGRHVVDLALRRGHEVVAFTRDPSHSIPGCEMRSFSTDRPPDITGCEALIHLAGEPIAGLWTPAKKRRIRDSRILGTRRLVEGICAAAKPPEVLVSGSAIGIYGDSGEAELTEDSPHGAGFLPDLVHDWEKEALCAREATRLVLLRTSIVLGKDGGALPMMAMPFRFGLGAVLGSGAQWMPWIHIEDQARLALFAIENLDLRGPLNAAAPWPVRNLEFTRTLAATLRRPAFLRVPAFALRLLGEFSHELLDSKRVLPAAATEHGFGFRYPELANALKMLLG